MTRLYHTLKNAVLKPASLFLFLTGNMLFAQTPPYPINGPDSVCEGELETYTSSLSAGLTYVWNISSGNFTASANTGNGTHQNNVNWGSSTGNDFISLNVYSSGSLISTDTLPIIILPRPGPSISSSFNSDCVPPGDKSDPTPGRDSISPCETVCEHTSVVYTTPYVAGHSYQWTVIGNFTAINNSNTHQATITWSNPGNAIVVVSDTSPLGCWTTDTICIEIVSKPTSSFYAYDASNPIYSVPFGTASAPTINGCMNSSICFYDNSTGATSWYWDFGNGNTSTQQNPCETFTIPGTYTVMLITENECHCKDTSYLYVFIEELPGPEIVCNNVVCDSGTYTYSVIMPNGPCPNGTYHWVVSGNGQINNANGSINWMNLNDVNGTGTTNISVTWNNGPIGTISLQVTGCSGVCSQYTTISIPIIPPIIDVTGDSILCIDEYGHFSVPCFPGTIFTWTVDSTVLPDQGHDIWYSFPAAGNYNVSVSYTNSFLNCSGVSNTFVVRVLNKFEINGLDEICQGSSTVITGPSTALNWEVKDASGSVVYTQNGGSSYNFPSSALPGSYTVIAHDAGSPRNYCNEYAVHGIVVVPSPPAPQSISGDIEVCDGQTYIYSASPSSSNYYLKWVVTNNSSPITSFGNSVTITWTTGSSKSISLYQVSKNNDCPSSPLTLNIVNKGFPSDTIIWLDTACANTNAGSPETYSTTQVTNNGYNYDGYNWSISPATFGSIVSGQNTGTINVIWNNVTGTATISLQPINCGINGPTITKNVEIINAPTLLLSGPSSICQGDPNIWTGSFSGGSGNNWTWNIKSASTGNIVQSGSGNPINYNFANNSGSFVITMSANGPNCNALSSATMNVTVLPKPVANLTYTGDKDCISAGAVNFNVSVQGTSPYTYQWYKNSTLLTVTGTTHSIGPNPADAGTYYVIVTDANGCSAQSNAIVVTNSCPPPPPPCAPSGGSVSFTYINTQIDNCTEVKFIESFVGPVPMSYVWQVSNLTTLFGSNPIYSFPASGVYTVTLTAGYGPGMCDETYTFDVVVPVQSDFELNIECIGNTMQVDLINTTNVAHGPLSLWTTNWDVMTMSNSSVATSASTDFINAPSLTGGNQYKVKLTMSRTYVWNGQTISAYCEILEIIDIPNSADANFSFSPSSPFCEDIPITFSDLSLGNIIDWNWNFGDGSTILTQHPQKTYANSGTYNVQLNVTDEYGCYDSMIVSGVQVKDNNLSGTISNSTAMPMCPGTITTLTFTNTTTPSSAPYTHFWSNGTNGLTTNVSQTSNNFMYVSDTYGCSAEFGPEIVEVVEIPDPQILGDVSVCEGENIELSSNYGSSFTYTWYQSGYGVVGSNSPYLSLQLSTGSYSFRVEISIAGCTKSSGWHSVVVNPLPAQPILTTNPSPACPDQPVQLSVINVTPYASVVWSNGASGTTTTTTSSGLYYAVGTDANGCSNSNSIEVYELPDFCSFMCGCYEDCIEPNQVFSFPGIVGFYNYWEWQQYVSGSWINVGSGTGTVQNWTTTNPGNYTIRLYVETLDSCSGTSCEADIYLEPCGDSIPEEHCEVDLFEAFANCTVNQNGIVEYNFNMSFAFYPSGLPCTAYDYTIIPPSGNISSFSLSPSQLISGFNNVSGTWNTGQSYFPGQNVCFNVVVTNPCDESQCYFTVCFDVPPCGEEIPSEIDDCLGSAEMSDVTCFVDPQGFVSYNFWINMNYVAHGGPCNQFTYQIVPPSGNAFVYSSPNITGSGSYSIGGTWATGVVYYPAGLVCFDVIITNTCDQSQCKYTVCYDFPQCGSETSGRLASPKSSENPLNANNSSPQELFYYPNPAKDILNVVIPEKGEYHFILRDLSGKTVLEYTLNSDENMVRQISIEGINPGLMLMECRGPGSAQFDRIIIR